RLAAPHAAADTAALTRLREANERLRTATDPEAAITADTDVHDVVVTLSGNPLLPRQLDTLVPILLRAEFLHFDAQPAAASAAQNAPTLGALFAGNGALAATLSGDNWLSRG